MEIMVNHVLNVEVEVILRRVKRIKEVLALINSIEVKMYYAVTETNKIIPIDKSIKDFIVSTNQSGSWIMFKNLFYRVKYILNVKQNGKFL
jgi:predicted mannosyl-3-phosphoglycerate phosphatase (HAD superfamily)